MKNPSLQSKSDEWQQNPKQRGSKWLLNSTVKFLFVTLCLTIAYLGFLLIDAGVLLIVGYLLKDLTEKYNYVQIGFEGLRIFSAVTTGLMYLCHLLYAIYDQVHFILTVFRRLRDEEEEKL